MKNVKKLLSILMVLTLVLALGAQAFAATVTIKGPENHTYAAYQVFTGTTTTIEGKGEVLASIQWANPTNAAVVLDALQGDDTIKSYFTDIADASDATKVAEAMGKITDVAGKQALARVLLGVKGSLVKLDEFKEGTNLNPGYYVIEDTTDVSGKPDAKNEIILEVVGSDVTVEVKQDVPTSQKKVQEKDDTAGTTSAWQDGADWDIGDDVPFQFVGTLPSNLDSYSTYTMVFHDKQSAGLTFNDDVKVYLGTKNEDGTYNRGAQVAVGGYTVNIPGTGAEETFSVTIPDVKKLDPAPTKDNVIIVEYTSELNSGAVIGAGGNPNEMQMEFSNNPDGEGTGKTTWDKVIVFTFDMDVNKIDGEGEALAGAGFTLLKKLPADTPAAGAVESLSPEKKEDGTIDEDTYPAAGQLYTDGTNVYEIVGVIKAGETTKFEFNGLDSGEYLLVESVVPDGYNKADDIVITVKATYDTDKDDPKLTDLEVTPNSFTVHSELANGMITGSVTNQSGLELPETGGIGTTIFYVAGAILVAGAVILLVTRKRMSGAEK